MPMQSEMARPIYIEFFTVLWLFFKVGIYRTFKFHIQVIKHMQEIVPVILQIKRKAQVKMVAEVRHKRERRICVKFSVTQTEE